MASQVMAFRKEGGWWNTLLLLTFVLSKICFTSVDKLPRNRQQVSNICSKISSSSSICHAKGSHPILTAWTTITWQL